MFFCSSARNLLNSPLPPVSSPNTADDFEVLSQRVSPDQQVVQGMRTPFEGDTFEAQGLGPNYGGLEQSGLQPDTNKRIPSKGGRTPSAASEDPEAPDILTNMLRQASA